MILLVDLNFSVKMIYFMSIIERNILDIADLYFQSTHF